ncbi:MAG: wax ester/triacylglycerol synthase family O-acyltransferase [Halieaceae bacterium]
MQQLTALDYMFLQQESPRTPMHISPVMIYDASEVDRGRVRFKEVLTVFERSLHKSTVFRRKLLDKTGGLDLPYWIEDDHFDLEFHVRHIALPSPGDWRQFCILLARLQSRGLDMTRPLWEAYVIEGLHNVEGLPPDSFAIMLKVHHSAIDGVSGAEIISVIHSLTADLPPPVTDDPWQPEKPPPLGRLWSKALSNNLKLPGKFFQTVGELVPAAIKANRLSNEHPESKATWVHTRFNGPVTSSRVTDTLRMDLQDIKDIRNAVAGSTINDVMVAIVGGGLRKYLQAHDELPDVSLTCGAPISVRPKEEQASAGNQVSMMTISLATDVEEPVARLQAVNHSAADGKAYSSALGAHAMMDITQSLSPRVLGLGMRAAFSAAMSAEMAMPSQVVVSNVPGPQFPLYMAGARLHTILGMGPLLDGMGLFNLVISGAGHICINFTACRQMLPDPDFYQQCLRESFAELKAAALKPAKGKSKTS